MFKTWHQYSFRVCWFVFIQQLTLLYSTVHGALQFIFHS